jgi:peptidoglycan hydrolase-like protein with peptidoglycan-binding domain
MGRHAKGLITIAVFAVALVAVGAALASAAGHLAGPKGSFTGTPTSSPTGSGNTGGGDDGFGSDDSRFGGGLGVASAGPGAALSGMSVAAVRTLQSDLAQLGYFHHGVTGYYGPVTTGAVKRFQRSAGLQIDGIWGPQSASALQRRLTGG